VARGGAGGRGLGPKVARVAAAKRLDAVPLERAGAVGPEVARVVEDGVDVAAGRVQGARGVAGPSRAPSPTSRSALSVTPKTPSLKIC
jgi:hypothetical protein